MTDDLHNQVLSDASKKHFGFLYPLKPLYEKAGIQFDQMIEIIELKSKVLGRTEQAQNAKIQKKNKNKGDSPVKSKDPGFFSLGKALSYLITSAFLMLYGFIFNEPATMLSIIFTVGFVMQFLSIVTSFPVLILATKDYTILATKPLNSKTISAAKTTVATLYMICTSGTIYGFTFVPFIFKGMWSVIPMMLIAVILSNLLCVALSYMLYGLILKFYDGEKLKDILSLFQIILTVFIMIGYQLIAQLQNIVDVTTKVSFHWWHLFVPPLWLSNFSATLLGPDYFLPGLLSFVLLTGIMVLHFSFTGKILEENLSKMLGEGEVRRGSYQLKLAFQERIGKFLFKDLQDQAFFILGYSVSSNDRKMKQTIYPMYVSMLILPALMIFNAWRDNPQPLRMVFDQNSWLIFSLYFAGITIGSVVMYAKRTEKPQGAWVYDVLPIRSQRRAFKVVGLNLILKYVLLPMVLFSILMLYLSGIGNVFNLITITLFTLLITLATLKSEKVDWPFSYELTYSEGKKGMMILVNLFAIGAFVGVHAACQYLLAPYGVPVLMVVTGASAWLIWRKI